MARVNVALEGFALTTFEEIRELAEQTGEELVAHCHDYNMADEVTHVGIGDYWLEKLSRGAAVAQGAREGRAAGVRDEHRDGAPDGPAVHGLHDADRKTTPA